MSDEFDDYQPPTIGSEHIKSTIRERLTEGMLAVSEEAAAAALSEEGEEWDPEKSTAKEALLILEQTEELLRLRANGLGAGECAVQLGISVHEVRKLLRHIANRFKSRQWAIYSELIHTRLERSEKKVHRILELMDHSDPYIRLAAHDSLRKDLEALPKIFGLSTTTINQMNMTSIQLGTPAGGELATLRKQMLGVIETSPEARVKFMEMLESDTRAEKPAIIDVKEPMPTKE